ncbi:MAG: DUF1489 family protein [Bdellovibrionales bacterium]
MIKLIVGTDSLEQYAQWQESQQMDYHGEIAVPCFTRFMPKRADEILRTGGSLYRVMKRRIMCRSKILGFEMVETSQGKKCMILQSPDIITTLNSPHRPFQGWRYFEAGKAPEDRGVFILGQDDDEPPEELSDDLREAGLL